MTYASWEPRYRVTTISPGRLDLFVATYVDGKLAAWEPIDAYEAELAKARAFLRDHQCQIKVLPMGGREMMNLLGLKPTKEPTPFPPAMHQALVDRLKGIARDSDDLEARRDAFDLLNDIGVIQQ